MNSPESQGEAEVGRLPRQSYKITFLPAKVTVEVDPERLPYGSHGRPGSVLDVALAAGVSIEHACGGFMLVRPATLLCAREPTRVVSRTSRSSIGWTRRTGRRRSRVWAVSVLRTARAMW